MKSKLFNMTMYFHFVFAKSDFILPPVSDLHSPKSQLAQTSISPNNVFMSLSILGSSKAPSCVDISPFDLRQCAGSLSHCHALPELFNKCLQSSSLPFSWKTPNICPVFMQGDSTDFRKSRPISLLCTLSKVFVSIIYYKILPFLHPLISNSQFGFFYKTDLAWLIPCPPTTISLTP